jgi:hypothetical protein
VTQNCGAKAQGLLGGEGGVGEDASGAVCPPYTNAYTYILTQPKILARFNILSAKYWLNVSFSVNTWSSYAHIGCYMSGNYWRIVTL